MDPVAHTNDFSLLALVLSADPIVKFVMFSLFVASFWCWAVIFEKMVRLSRLKKQTSEFENLFWSGTSLEALYERVQTDKATPITAVFSAAMREWKRVKGQLTESALFRIEKAMDLTINKEVEGLEKYMTFLASVGSTAPFIGLFGTVWGIMNSFQAIAQYENTNLAIVAPGIAEALFATALGLVAAIPAVLAYNKLSSEINRYANRLDAFSEEFSGILNRQQG